MDNDPARDNGLVPILPIARPKQRPVRQPVKQLPPVQPHYDRARYFELQQ